MPGRTDADSGWNAVVQGARDGASGQEKQQSPGGGHEQQEDDKKPADGWVESGNRNVSGWGNAANARDSNNNNTASAWREEPLYTAEGGWEVPESKIETMEDLLRNLAVHAEDFKKDLIPFYLKSVAAAEMEESEVKLESFLEEKIQARKASGWYWMGSDEEKKDGDGWSNHKASDNGWGITGDNGWGVQQGTWEGWGPKDEAPQGNSWGVVQKNKPKPTHNRGHSARKPRNKRDAHG